jgi:hypothetical protein
MAQLERQRARNTGIILDDENPSAMGAPHPSIREETRIGALISDS